MELCVMALGNLGVAIGSIFERRVFDTYKFHKWNQVGLIKRFALLILSIVISLFSFTGC